MPLVSVQGEVVGVNVSLLALLRLDFIKNLLVLRPVWLQGK
jgi:hypothetical protein